MAVDRERVEALVRELLDAIGEDPERDGLRDTPRRVADSWATFFAGVGADASAPLAATIPVGEDAAADAVRPSGAVLVRGIRFRSMCEHHLLPFAGVAHIAYLPGTQVVGLGALPKVVAVAAARPQVQERLGEQIADALSGALDCRGVLVVLDAAHQCVTMRDRTQPDASTVTVAARGDLAEPAARAELMALIGGDRL